MRIGYAHADSLLTYPDADNLSTSSQPIRIVTTYPREHTLTATGQSAVAERAWCSSAVLSTCHRWRSSAVLSTCHRWRAGAVAAALQCCWRGGTVALVPEMYLLA